MHTENTKSKYTLKNGCDYVSISDYENKDVKYNIQGVGSYRWVKFSDN